MTKPPAVVFHPGTQHSWQTARALQDMQRLAFFATSIYYDPARWPYRLQGLPGNAGRRFRREFSRFAIPGLDPALVRSGGVSEWLERIATRVGFHELARRIDLFGNRRFVRHIANDIRSDRPFALWGYNNSSLEAFALAKAHGRPCILDRTIGDWRAYDRVMLSIQETYGDWFETGFRPTDAAIIEREAQEHGLADRILLGCEFAARTVRNENPAAAHKVEVLEYCYDPRFDAAMPRAHDPNAPVRFLFAGLGIPRKGIHHVLEAISRIPERHATLTILGSLQVPDRVLSPHAARINHLPTVPRHEVPQIMAEHDVLVFPTYFEGAGIVLYEALAAGMALVQTPYAAKAVTPETGIMLPRPDTDLLVEAMESCIADRVRLAAWKQAAPSAAANYRFDSYRSRIDNLLARMDM